jgi:FkbM family methyltransferase
MTESLVSKVFKSLNKVRLLKKMYQGIVPFRLRYDIWRSSVGIAQTTMTLNEMLLEQIQNKSIDFEKAPEVLRFLQNNKKGLLTPKFFDIWLEKCSGAAARFNFNGAMLPDITNDRKSMYEFYGIFVDTLLFHVFYNGDYGNIFGKKTVTMLEKTMLKEPWGYEGPYGYTDGGFDVSVKKGDVVIDAGAYIGDFSAYAAAKGAVCYGFEPTETTFQLLRKTAELNGGKVIPVQKGLGNTEGEVELFIDNGNAGGNTINAKRSGEGKRKKNISTIKITTLDTFVREQGLTKIDFIKADIEGAERDMLAGARNTLRDFAPKLAICTYHLPDDPQVLERLILDANPKYKVRQGPKKLYASI